MIPASRDDLRREIERIDALLAIARAQAAASSGFETTFVFRPGDPGTLAPNVFTDWNVLMARVATVQGPKIIQIQNTFVAVPVIPAGIYDLADCILEGTYRTAGFNIQCDLADGVQFLNFCQLRDGLVLNSLSTTVPVMTQGASPFILSIAAGIQNDPTSTVPFLHIDAGSTQPVVLMTGGTIGRAGNPASVSVDLGAQFTCVLDIFAGLTTNTVVGLGAAFVFVSSQAAFINTAFPITQAGIGTLVVLLFFFAQFTQYSPAAPADWVAPPPTDVQQALDRLAAQVVVLSGGAPIP